MANITTPQEWKKASGGTDLTVPSGQTCRARRVDLRIFVKTGKVPNTLRSLLDQAAGGKEISAEEITKQFLEDPSVFGDMMEMVDLVVCDCVLEPKVHPVPEEGTARDDELIYVDDISPEDRMFIFNYAVGGTADFETFREQSTPHVERVLALSGDGGTAE